LIINIDDSNEELAEKRLFLLEELKALGFSRIRLNEFNDNNELSYLVESVKDFFIFDDPAEKQA
jgi:hypothetical protein